MAPRRRKADATPAWWHARVSYVLALLMALAFAPTVWTSIVTGVVRLVDRLGDAEHDIRALRADVSRLDAELRDLRTRRR